MEHKEHSTLYYRAMLAQMTQGEHFTRTLASVLVERTGTDSFVVDGELARSTLTEAADYLYDIQ